MAAKDAVNSDARLGCIAGPVSEKATTAVMKTKKKRFPEQGLNGPLAPQRSVKLLIGEADPSYVKISFVCQSYCREFKSCVTQCVHTGE